MDRILIGAEAAVYLKANPEFAQTVQETGRGVRVAVGPCINLEKLECEVICKLIDSLIADRTEVEGVDISDFTAHLYSARHHVVRAIKEVQS